MAAHSRIRVLALIYPIERHVGHWACSSDSIELERVIMEEREIESVLLERIRAFEPEAIALVGKQVQAYHAILDRISQSIARVKGIPRIYRCQNTNVRQRFGDTLPTREQLANHIHWLASACDERFALILVQTLTDVDVIRRVLAPKMVIACPYGYDPAIFNPDLPEVERTVDVGCYFSLKDDPRRLELVRVAEEVCAKRGWTFRFESGKYWHDYANLMRTTRVCLHRSEHSEVPFRIYESTCFGTVFLTDPLGCGIECLFQEGEEYLTYQPDLGDLEAVLESVLADQARWESISRAGKARARDYAWPQIAETYVLPALRELLRR
jgi:hypothetical protein